MKRLITFAAALLMAACLAACSAAGGAKTNKPNGLDSSFQAAVGVILEDLNAEGTIKRFGNGMWEVEFTSPNSLSGVKLSFSEGNVTASNKGRNFSVPQSALPVKAMMLNLISAVDELAGKEQLSGEEKDGMLEISGTLDGGEYTLTVDGDGNISSFSMPGSKLTVTFSDILPIAQETTSQASSESVTSTGNQAEGTTPAETSAAETSSAQ